MESLFFIAAVGLHTDLSRLHIAIMMLDTVLAGISTNIVCRTIWPTGNELTRSTFRQPLTGHLEPLQQKCFLRINAWGLHAGRR